MSDHSNSTGSTGSSTNSWTLLSPEEAAVESVGPVDDGTESLGDVPSLSEELAGAAAEFKHIDIPIETVLSEEGHQVCQETTPEPSEGTIPTSPSRISPLPHHSFEPSEVDPESQPPVIHDIVASSPSDNDNLCAIPFVTNLDLGTPLEIPASDLLQSEPDVCCATDNPVSAVPVSDEPADIGPISETQEEESPNQADEQSKPVVPLEALTAAEATEPLPSVQLDDSQREEESHTEEQSAVPEVSEVPLCPAEVEEEHTPAPAPVEETGEPYVETEEAPEAATRKDEEQGEPEPSFSFESGDTAGFDDGLRRRNLPSFEAPRARTSDEEEEDEEEEVEFKMEEKKETKPWLSVNKCIAAGLVLLFLGSLFLSGDFDGAEVTDGEQSQDWLSGDPKEMKELLDKLTQENQQIAQLEAQLKAQKEELDLALKVVTVNGDEKRRADLETENVKLKDELLVLPDLKKELETLRARVTELSALSAPQAAAPAPSPPVAEPSVSEGPTNLKPSTAERKSTPNEARVKEELQRQKTLLEESRKRLETMKNKDGSDRKHVRDNLAEIQKRLSEKVEKWGKKKPEESKWKGNKDKRQWKKEDKKEFKGGKDKKHKKEGGRGENEVKSKHISHKEAWRKSQDEWEQKKGERRMDREKRRREKPWHNKSDKKSHESRQQKPHQQHDFWRDQELKLNRNIRPQLGCTNVEDCAAKEGLYPVELSEFEELLEGYLSKLDDPSSFSGKDKIRKLTAQFFEDGVFIHDRMRFGDFAEDVADILEDAVDILEGKKDNDSLEEEMEEFEREALWKFAATA